VRLENAERVRGLIAAVEGRELKLKAKLENGSSLFSFKR
jgi:hypothetical protein